MCPIKVRKVDGYQVSHGGTVSAKRTTKKKAERQANLLRGVAHGWTPTGATARDIRESKKATVHKKMSTRSRSSRKR